METAVVNQRQLADRLNLSTATISKCFNSHSDISLETRARVLDAAREVGYRLRKSGDNRQARRMPKRVFVAVLFYTYESQGLAGDPPGTGYLIGLSQAAEAEGVTLLIHRCGNDAELPGVNRLPPPALQPGLAKGLVVIHSPPAGISPWTMPRLPSVSLVHRLAGRCDRVDADHASGIDEAVSHLIELNHHRIGFLGCGTARSYTHERYGSFVAAMSRHRLPLTSTAAVNVTEDVPNPQHQADLVTKQIQAGVRAWVCASDHAGYELWRRLFNRGYKAPRDVSIIGVDGCEPLFGCPRLTTVKLPFIEMGAAALQLVYKRIRQPDRPVECVGLLPTFEVHETTGVARYDECP